MIVKGVVSRVIEGKDSSGEFSTITSVNGIEIRLRGTVPKEVAGANFVYETMPLRDPEDCIGIVGADRPNNGEDVAYQFRIDRWVGGVDRFCGYWVN